jgi:hypothetical protein
VISAVLGMSLGGGCGVPSASWSPATLSISALGGLTAVYFGMSTIGTIRGVIVFEGVTAEVGKWMCDPAGIWLWSPDIGAG